MKKQIDVHITSENMYLFICQAFSTLHERKIKGNDNKNSFYDARNHNLNFGAFILILPLTLRCQKLALIFDFNF